MFIFSLIFVIIIYNSLRMCIKMSIISIIDNLNNLTNEQELFSHELSPILFRLFVTIWIISFLIFIVTVLFIIANFINFGFITSLTLAYIFLVSMVTAIFSSISFIFVDFISDIFAKLFIRK